MITSTYFMYALNSNRSRTKWVPAIIIDFGIYPDVSVCWIHFFISIKFMAPYRAEFASNLFTNWNKKKMSSSTHFIADIYIYV